MKRSIVASCLAACAAATSLLSSTAAFAGPVDDLSKDLVAPPDNPAWTQPLIGGGAKTNNVYTDGNIFLTVPVWSTIGRDGTLGGDYIFLEPYSSLGEQGEVATSLGLSWRHLFSDESTSALQKQGMARFMEEGWFIGGNFFTDMLDTQHNNNFWQLGVGAEAGTRYVEVRGNYYIPLTGEKLYERDVNTQTYTSSSTSLATQDTYGNPFATGNSIQQPVASQTLANTTTTSTTVRTVTELFEKGMRGWDAELSVLTPWVDQWMDLRWSAGYLGFDNQPFGPQNGPTGPVHGWKAGMELRPVPAVVLGADWYEDKRFTGANWIVSAELQIPLDHTWKDAFRMRRRHLVEHLAEPVHRQNDAIKIGNDENQSSTSSTSVAHVTTVVSQTATNIVLRDDVVFVNNGGPVRDGIQAGSATGTGTAQNPVNTVQSGATLAGNNSTNTGKVWMAYVQGGGPNYVEDVNAVGSVHLFGSSQIIPGQGGKAFGGGANPVLNGAIVADASTPVILPKFPTTVTALPINVFTVRGFTILNGDSNNELAPIDLTDINRIAIVKNTILNANGDAIDISVDNQGGSHTSNALVASNTINNPGFAGVSLIANDSGAVLNALVRKNTISGAQGDGIDVLATGAGNGSGGAQITAKIINNTIASPEGYGVSIEVDNNGTSVTVAANNNTITSPGIGGIESNSNQSSTLNLTASGNVISASGGTGFDITANDSSVVNFTVVANVISSPTAYAVVLNSGDSATLNGTVSGNTISNAGFDAIFAQIQNTTAGTGANLTITGNTITSPGGTGFNTQVSNSAQLMATITGNTITSALGGGVSLNGDDSASVTATVSGNTISGLGDSSVGVGVTALGSSVLSVTSNGNTIGKTTTGFNVEGSDSAQVTFTASGNVINGGVDSVEVGAGSSAVVQATLTGNTINNSTESAVSAGAANSASLTMFINQNALNNISGVGFDLQQLDSGTFSVNPAPTALINNTVTGTSSWMTNTGTITGSIEINGNTYTLPTNAP